MITGFVQMARIDAVSFRNDARVAPIAGRLDRDPISLSSPESLSTIESVSGIVIMVNMESIRRKDDSIRGSHELRLINTAPPAPPKIKAIKSMAVSHMSHRVL
jgi:hypothetical protein